MAKKKIISPTEKRLKTLAAKREPKKEKLIAEFCRCPIVGVTCSRVGVGRSTYYDWFHADMKFAEYAKKAIAEGNDSFNDLAEAKLFEKIKEGNMTAVIFRLKNFHDGYKEKKRFELAVEGREFDEEEQREVSRALHNLGLGELVRRRALQDEKILKQIVEEYKDAPPNLKQKEEADSGHLKQDDGVSIDFLFKKQDEK